MKNKLYQALLLIFLVAGISSCDYLDIVPDERPTEEDAFKDKNAAERYLYSCYAFMPKEREGCYLYQGGDCLTDYDRKFLEGTHTAANIGDFAYVCRYTSLLYADKQCRCCATYGRRTENHI